MQLIRISLGAKDKETVALVFETKDEIYRMAGLFNSHLSDGAVKHGEQHLFDKCMPKTIERKFTKQITDIFDEVQEQGLKGAMTLLQVRARKAFDKILTEM